MSSGSFGSRVAAVAMRCVLGRPEGQTGRAGARKEIAAEEQAHKECLVAEEER